MSEEGARGGDGSLMNGRGGSRPARVPNSQLKSALLNVTRSVQGDHHPGLSSAISGLKTGVCLPIRAL